MNPKMSWPLERDSCPSSVFTKEGQGEAGHIGPGKK